MRVALRSRQIVGLLDWIGRVLAQSGDGPLSRRAPASNDDDEIISHSLAPISLPLLLLSLCLFLVSRSMRRIIKRAMIIIRDKTTQHDIARQLQREKNKWPYQPWWRALADQLLSYLCASSSRCEPVDRAPNSSKARVQNRVNQNPSRRAHSRPGSRREKSSPSV